MKTLKITTMKTKKTVKTEKVKNKKRKSGLMAKAIKMKMKMRDQTTVLK